MKLSKRQLLWNIGAAGVGLHAALGDSAPARAGVGWGPGPNSGLPFWLGAHGDFDALKGLMPVARSLDLVAEGEGEGTYTETALRAKFWRNKIWHRYLITGQASAFHWSSSPFCSGNTFVVPTAWPTSAAAVTSTTHLNCSRPPTYTGTESLSEQASKQRRVWQIAADGWLDQQWRDKMLAFKRDYFIANGLKNIRIILRSCKELNTMPVRWGSRAFERSYGMMVLTSADDYRLVRMGMSRYFDVFLDIFGNRQAGIVNDYAYSADQLWPYWNTVKKHQGPVDVRLACPDNAKIVGPDYYDFWPASFTDAIWNKELIRTSPQGWPIGLQRWLEWARQIGKPLALGEFGLMAKSITATGERPASEGWDNPAFIKLMLDFCTANASDIAFVNYFNRDNSASESLPAHLMKPWDGIDSPTASCERTPPGDNLRCGARAFRQWTASHS